MHFSANARPIPEVAPITRTVLNEKDIFKDLSVVFKEGLRWKVFRF
jgi:hypothetical protein